MRASNIQETNQTALAAFIARKVEFDVLLERLQIFSAEHFNLSPDAVHWGHAGDISRYVAALRSITDAAFSEGE